MTNLPGTDFGLTMGLTGTICTWEGVGLDPQSPTKLVDSQFLSQLDTQEPQRAMKMTVATLPTATAACTQPPLPVLDDTVWLPWCGLLICNQSLQVRNNYDRLAERHLEHSMTNSLYVLACSLLSLSDSHLTVYSIVWSFGKIYDQLCKYLEIKCHPILYDPALNSQPLILFNVYQASTLPSLYHEAASNGVLSRACW